MNSSEKILIVEDEKDIARMLEYNLKKEGCKTIVLHEGGSVVRTAAKERPSLIILDIMLPGLDGLEVCRRLKKDDATRSIPVIMLTARSEESDKIVGLELGADDYVTKPFSVKELLARIRAVLRRSSGEDVSEEIYLCGGLELDVSRVMVLAKGKPVELTAREFELLKALFKAKGRVIGRGVLLDIAWGLDPSAAVQTRTVDVHIGTLRKKLGAEGRRIVTVKNYGYKLDVR